MAINKDLKKILSVIVVGSMALSLAACSKPSAKKLDSVATGKLDAEEVALEDVKDLKQKDLKDGIVITATGDEIEEEFGKDIKKARKSAEDSIDDVEDKAGVGLDDFGIDLDDWDTEDIKNVTAYIKLDGDDAEEGVFEFALVLELEDASKGNETFESFMEGIEDLLDLDVDELSKDEYKNDGKKGYFIVNLDGETIIDIVVDVMSASYKDSGYDLSKDDIKEMKKSLSKSLPEELALAFGIYYDNGTFSVIVGFSGEGDLENITTLAKGIGVDDPTSVENSEAMLDSFGNLGSFASLLGSVRF